MRLRLGFWLTLLAVSARAGIVLSQDGVLYPDEVHQSLEQAHRLLWHTGFVPWEWTAGARHPAFVWLLTAALWVGSAIGLAPHLAGRLTVALFAGLTTWPVMSGVERLGGSKTSARAAGLLWALSGWAMLLGARALSENAVTFPLTLGVVALLTPKASARQLVLGALLLSLATMLRLQAGLIAAMALAVSPSARSWQSLRVLLAAFLGGVFLFGALDALQWGSWFHSAREYWDFNVVQGRASEFGTEPASYFLRAALLALGGTFALFVLGGGAVRRAPGLVLLITTFIAIHALVGHKELRFLFPVLPLGCVAFGLSLDSWLTRFGRPALGMLALIAVQVPPWKMTFSMLGIPNDPPTALAWDAGGPVNRLLARAGRTGGVCGVLLRDFEIGYSGSYAWLHAPVPLFDGRQVPATAALYDLVIARSAPSGTLLATDGPFTLTRVGNGCATAPIDWSLK